MEEEEASSSSTATTSSSEATSTLSNTSSTSISTISTGTPNAHYRRAFLDGEIRQLFSLPESIIYYIAMHPANAEVYKKLIRTCKYFYNKNPIFVVNQLWFNITKNGDGEWKYSMKNERCDKGALIDMDKLQRKLWISYDFSVAPSFEAIHCFWTKGEKKYERISASIIPKIYRSDAARIFLQRQVMSFNDFVLLASNVEDLIVEWCTIYEEDDVEVMFEKIIEKLPKLRKLEWHFFDPCECMSSNTVAELLKLEHVGNINMLMHDIPEVFDVKALFQAIKLKHKNMEVNLYYVNDLSAQFKQKINEIVDEIISTEELTYMPPKIYYYGLDRR